MTLEEAIFKILKVVFQRMSSEYLGETKVRLPPPLLVTILPIMHLGPAIFKLSKSFPNALPAGGAYFKLGFRQEKIKLLVV